MPISVEPPWRDPAETQVEDPAKRWNPDRVGERKRLRTNVFDAVTSLLLALVLTIGAGVLFLWLVWQGAKTEVYQVRFPPVEKVASIGGGIEDAPRDFELPGDIEVEPLREPAFDEVIAAITDSATSVAARSSEQVANRMDSSSGIFQGDDRSAGIDGEGEDMIPRFQRWKLEVGICGS